MASAWGSSWGSAWGNSWGLITTVSQAGGGLWGYGRKRKYHPWITLPEEIYKEILEEDILDEIQAEAIKIVRPFIEEEKKAVVPQPATIDWKAFAENQAKVSQMIRLWEEVVERQRLEIEEEENITLLLLYH